MLSYMTYTMLAPKNKRFMSQNTEGLDRIQESRHPAGARNYTIIEWPLVCEAINSDQNMSYKPDLDESKIILEDKFWNK